MPCFLAKKTLTLDSRTSLPVLLLRSLPIQQVTASFQTPAFTHASPRSVVLPLFSLPISLYSTRQDFWAQLRRDSSAFLAVFRYADPNPASLSASESHGGEEAAPAASPPSPGRRPTAARACRQALPYPQPAAVAPPAAAGSAADHGGPHGVIWKDCPCASS